MTLRQCCFLYTDLAHNMDIAVPVLKLNLLVQFLLPGF